MPRVKRSVHARKKRRKVLEQAKGYWGLKSTNYTYAKEQVEHSLVYAYRDRKNRKRDVPAALDHADQRRRAGARALVQPVHLGPEGGERRARPQGARRPRGQRPGRRSASSPSRPSPRWRIASSRRRPDARRQRDIFLRQAEYCDSRSPLYAALCRRLRRRRARSRRSRPTCAGTCRCASSAALHYLVLGGEASWDDDRPRRSTSTAGFLARFAAEQRGRRTRSGVRGRCCRAAREVGAERLDLVELGASGGLLLAADRYAYRYRAGDVGRRRAAARRGRSRRAARRAARAAGSRSCAAAGSTSSRST